MLTELYISLLLRYQHCAPFFCSPSILTPPLLACRSLVAHGVASWVAIQIQANRSSRAAVQRQNPIEKKKKMPSCRRNDDGATYMLMVDQSLADSASPSRVNNLTSIRCGDAHTLPYIIAISVKPQHLCSPRHPYKLHHCCLPLCCQYVHSTAQPFADSAPCPMLYDPRGVKSTRDPPLVHRMINIDSFC